MRIIGAEAAWAVGTGANTTIAIVDTGVDPDHEDLRGKVLAGRNFVDPGKPAHDDNGHGTHVAGIAAALTNNGIGVTGVAPDAHILPVKVLAGDGRGNSGDIVAGIRWAADSGATVINVSLGVGVDFRGTYIAATGPALRDAVNYAWGKGAIVVVAAGNDESAVNVFADQNVVVVTATDDADRKAAYATNAGLTGWRLAAPGGAGEGPSEKNILSTYWVSGAHDKYAWAAGTSMAAPHVSGAAAILRERGLDKDQTVARLRTTAKDLGAPGRDEVYGDGRLDLARAVQGLPRAPRAGATGSGGSTATTAKPVGPGSRPTTTTAAVGSSPGAPVAAGAGGVLEVEPFDANGAAPGGTEEVVGEAAGGSGGDRTGGTGGDERPWAPAAVGAGLLAAAVAGIVRARRA